MLPPSGLTVARARPTALFYLETATIEYAADGRKRASLEPYFTLFTAEERAALQVIHSDSSRMRCFFVPPRTTFWLLFETISPRLQRPVRHLPDA